VSWLGRLLRPPVFADEAQTHHAFMLHVILWSLVGVPVVYVLLTAIVAPEGLPGASVEALAGQAANVALLALLRHGHVRLASALQVVAFFAFFSVLAATSSGVNSPAYMLGYGLTIVIAGVLLGGNGAFAVTLAALVAGALMATSRTSADAREPASGLFIWGVSATLFPVSAVVQNLAARTVRRALERARSSEAQYRLLVNELEARNAELERFTYTVSHDLKSPLFTLRGYLDYMGRDARSGNLERLQGDIGRSVDAADKMRRLLDDLLQLSRVGRIMNAPVEVPFGDVAREAVALARGRLDERSVSVTIGADLPFVRGDRARLVEVVQNLVDNAAKFMGDEKQPRIEIGAREASGAPVFFVRDNGIGIPPRHQERVFRLFDKLEAGGEGTGVGLALVKRIVELHGGRIWVESDGSKGSSFCFTLPRPASSPGR
jgi:signal transduction histidine kinase